MQTPVPSTPLPPSIAAALAHVAEASPHLGVFSTAHAHRAGLSDEVLRSLVRSGQLVRPARGWYHRADPDLTAVELHRRAAAAQVRRRRGAGVASHHSALVEYGIPALGADLATVHVTHRASASYRVGRGCVVHRADVSTCAGELAADATAVAVPFAIVQAGMLNGPLSTLVGGDYALGRGLTTSDALVGAAAAYRRTAGIAAVAAVVAHLDGRAESPAESLARYAVGQLGYAVVPQRWVRSEGRHYRVDLAIEGTPLVIEVDGKTKYRAQDAGEVIMEEKARHSSLERAGWTVLRLTWREIITPTGTLRLANLRTLIEARLRHPAA